MKTSNYWLGHFKNNALQQRINWEVAPNITRQEVNAILSSLRAWQLGETSEGRSLIAAATKYAHEINDPLFLEVIKLFIKEEQKHGNNLGMYLDRIGKPRKTKDWGDSLFRWTRHLNTHMESWTLAVIAVETTAQIFYQALKDATNCTLLKSICTDILIDEAYHIQFQNERLAEIFERKSTWSKQWRKPVYRYFFYATATLVWLANKRLFNAGGITLGSYFKKMRYKYHKTIEIITGQQVNNENSNLNLKYGL